MAVLSRTKRQEKLSLWNVSDPLRVTRLKSQYIDLGIKSEFDSSIKMDDRFIFISAIRKETTKFYFFSKKTLELHWKKTVNGCIRKRFVYDKGLLIIYVSKQNDKSEEYGAIQVNDVKSRSCFREMRITAYGMYGFHRFNHKVGVNSKFMVVARAIQYCPPYKLYVYDLEAVKNTKSPKGELLVHTLTVKFDFNGIVIALTPGLQEGCHSHRAVCFRMARACVYTARVGVSFKLRAVLVHLTLTGPVGPKLGFLLF